MIPTVTAVLAITTFLGSIIVTIMGYFLKQAMNELKETKDLAIRTKSELDVLKNDHTNKHESMTEKFDDLKDSIITLTKEIKELTSQIKK
jgi:predicted  nucleic acid-binding Zn-ribbon protein